MVKRQEISFYSVGTKHRAPLCKQMHRSTAEFKDTGWNYCVTPGTPVLGPPAQAPTFLLLLLPLIRKFCPSLACTSCFCILQNALELNHPTALSQQKKKILFPSLLYEENS
jgi:hypothetical protein